MVYASEAQHPPAIAHYMRFCFYKNKKAVAVQLLIAGEPRELKNEPQFFVTEDKEFFVKITIV